MVLLTPVVAACALNGGSSAPTVKRAAFTSKDFGVSASPRVTTAKFPPRGGGRALPAKPYQVAGVTYEPVDGPGYVARGLASWYGEDFHGRRTANGEIFGAYYLTAASPVLPVPSYARVTNLENGRSVLVRINDRGPYLQGRVADLSYEAASILDYVNKGSAEIEIKYVGPAPVEGDDTRMLMASVDRPTSMEQQGDFRVAMVDTPKPRSVPTSRDPLSGGLLGQITSLFGYAELPTSGAISSAVDAASAMASRASALDSWKSSVDVDARKVRLDLGTFADRKSAIAVAEAFAVLGAVDEVPVKAGSRAATRLTLTHLKPGVARTDVQSLAQQLGLTGIVLY
jgi:rare lipoprotein A